MVVENGHRTSLNCGRVDIPDHFHSVINLGLLQGEGRVIGLDKQLENRKSKS